MGGFSTKKMMFQQLLTSVLLLHLLISSSSGALVNSSENGLLMEKLLKIASTSVILWNVQSVIQMLEFNQNVSAFVPPSVTESSRLAQMPTLVIVPCGASNGIICVKVFKWGTNGTSFCEAVGFTVDQTADVSACYGSSISSFGPAVKSLIKTENVGWFQDLKKLVREMTLVQQFSWVVALSAADASYDPEGCEKIDKIHEWEDL
ncbi:hypothetical protein YC2023_005142 [Brassica napus]